MKLVLHLVKIRDAIRFTLSLGATLVTIVLSFSVFINGKWVFSEIHFVDTLDLSIVVSVWLNLAV